MTKLTSCSDASPVAAVAFTVRPSARVEWQVVKRNTTPDSAGWQDAGGVREWSFSLEHIGLRQRRPQDRDPLVSEGFVLADESVAVRLA